MKENTQWKWCYRSIFLAAIFIITCLSAFSFIDSMSGGYAVAFISIFLAIASIAIAALFFHRAKVMDSILNSTHLLAHWVYSSIEAEKAAKNEYSEYRERNRALFFIIGGMLILSALIMAISGGYEGFITGVFLLGFTVLLFIVSRVVPVLTFRNALRAPNEAYIANEGIIYEGTVYPFRSFLMRLVGIKLRVGSRNKLSAVVFSFDQLIGFYIYSPFDIEVPVPEGKEEMARNIADMLESMVT